MAEMFTMMKQYFKPQSFHKKILTTCEHMNLKFKDSFEMFAIERCMGGLNPAIDNYSVADSFDLAGFKVLLHKDYSWHYYYASYCDLNHFGNPNDIGLLAIFLGHFVFPHILYFVYVLNDGYWMWQWSGRHHKRRTTPVCDEKIDCDLYFEKDSDKRPVTLFYTIAQLI